MKVSVIVIMICISLFGNAQDTVCNLEINNDEISFSLQRFGIDFTRETTVKAEILIETNIKSEKMWERFKLIKVEEWLCLLTNQATDWAANLILYQLHERDALLFKKIKKREDWVKGMKERDIAYWKIFLLK